MSEFSNNTPTEGQAASLEEAGAVASEEGAAPKKSRMRTYLLVALLVAVLTLLVTLVLVQTQSCSAGTIGSPPASGEASSGSSQRSATDSGKDTTESGAASGAASGTQSTASSGQGEGSGASEAGTGGPANPPAPSTPSSPGGSTSGNNSGGGGSTAPEPVWHEPWDEQVWRDTSHYEEVYVCDVPVYEYHSVCNTCGAIISGHAAQHLLDSEHCESYTTDVAIQVGSQPYYETRWVASGYYETIHHEGYWG